MIKLTRISDPVLLQVISDALASRGIDFHINNAGMNALMPLPTVMDACVLVAEDDKLAAEQIMHDLEIDT